MSAPFLTLLASAPTLALGISLRPRLGIFPLMVAALCTVWILLMRSALPGFGRRLTLLSVAMATLMIGSLLPRVLWRGSGEAATYTWFYSWVVLPATVVQVTMMAGLVSAPLWVLLGRLAKRQLRSLPVPTPLSPPQPAEPALPPQSESESQSPPLALVLPAPLARRALLTAAPWVIPGGALIISTYGTLIESRRIAVRRLQVAVPGLPPSLHGLRIGQITDIHVARLQTQMRHLEKALALLAAEHVDLICPTGDLCDEPRLHRDVLRLIKQVPARLGHYACLGNHELYLGNPDWIRRCYEQAQIQLLEDESVLIGELRLAGISYPHSSTNSRMEPQIVPELLTATLRDQKPGEPTVLLAHHPHVFQQVSGRGVALQLSGHTHGGQLGFGERSWIEPIYPLARGRYRTPDGATQMFVSSGLGHWLPFRVNCPPEVVIIELTPA